MTSAAAVRPGANWPSAVGEALAMPRGATWQRVALQVNPYGYRGSRQPSSAFPDEKSYNDAIVAGCREAGIGLIAITDHWNVESAESLTRTAEEAGVRVLPGFEAVSSEGVHLLVLFERETDHRAIDAAIGACGGTPGCGSGTPGRTISEILACADDRGAVVVPAHVNGDNGLLTTLQGQALARVWRDERIHAVCVSPERPVSPAQARMLDNTEHEYRRRHAMSVLHSDDICEPSRLADDSGSCWVKMSEPYLAALDLATRTPETRVRLTDPNLVAPSAIEAIAWDGGFLDGVRLRLSDSLTCLVGGRGTGKSTIVESVRYALGLEAIGQGARRDQHGLVDHVLGAGTKITLLVRGPNGEFVVERSVPDPPVVRDASGTALASRPVDVLGPIEVFGQHELAELADSPEYMAELLRRISGTGTTTPTTVPARLGRNRDAIVAARTQLAEIDDALDELPRLEEALVQFHGAHLDERLDERNRVNRERHILATAGRRLDDLDTAALPLRDDDLLDRSFAAPEVLADLPNASLLTGLTEAMTTARTELSKALQTLDRAVTTARATLAAIEADWSAVTSEARDRYDAALRALQAEGYDASAYVATQQAVQRLAPLSEQRAQIAARIQALYDERRQLLAELTDHASEERRRLGRACSEAAEPVQKTVRVKPQRSEDRTAILKVIDDGVHGQRGQIKNAAAQDDFSPRALADAARAGTEALARFGIRGAQAANLVAAGEELFLRLEEMTVGLAVAVSLNLGTTPSAQDFRPLSELSKGQKATALLLLLLSTARGPLIVDQPEDDLDNRFIWEGIVPRVREIKGTRQLVFSTHNANIPVLGDAEQVLVMETDGQRQGRVADGGVGSLDDPSVLRLAEAILEGGPDAFLRRRYLYGF